MIYLNAFIFAGITCLVSQIILNNTKLMPGHITAFLVVLGAFLDIFGIYDYFVNMFSAGAIVCITSFGHLLIHGALLKAKVDGVLGLFSGILSLVSAGIASTIIFSFIFALIFKPKD